MFKHLPSSFAWMAVFFAALGTLFFVIGAHTLYRNWQFSGPVERVIGMVTNRNITVSHSRHGSSTHYHVSYHYVDVQGATFFTSVTVTSQTYYSLGVPGGVPIKFLPQYHAINRIDLPAEDSSYETLGWLFTLLGGGFGGFGWYCFIGLERLIFSRRWLRKNGVRCQGRIDRFETTTVTVNKRNVRYLIYTYTDSVGQQHQDSSEGLSATEEAIWSEGETIPVFCDPRDSARSAVLLDKP
jgi:hypothetical protein